MNKKTIKTDWIRNRSVYFLAIPILIYFIIWNYIPMVGIMLGFQITLRAAASCSASG
jgi:ABC-type polysaccharide transport system permease subunit